MNKGALTLCSFLILLLTAIPVAFLLMGMSSEVGLMRLSWQLALLALALRGCILLFIANLPLQWLLMRRCDPEDVRYVQRCLGRILLIALVLCLIGGLVVIGAETNRMQGALLSIFSDFLTAILYAVLVCVGLYGSTCLATHQLCLLLVRRILKKHTHVG